MERKNHAMALLLGGIGATWYLRSESSYDQIPSCDISSGGTR